MGDILGNCDYIRIEDNIMTIICRSVRPCAFVHAITPMRSLKERDIWIAWYE